MHRPDPFRNDSLDLLQRVLNLGPLVTIVSATPQLHATAIPVLLDLEATSGPRLRGHVSARNPILDAILQDERVLLIAKGGDAYISPSNYARKATDRRVVPTWDYVEVHVRGTARVVDDLEFVRSVVTDLTDRFERQRPDPWSVSDAPADYISKSLRAIRAVEVTIADIEGAQKLSQNRPIQDIATIKADLAQGSGSERIFAGWLDGPAGVSDP